MILRCMFGFLAVVPQYSSGSHQLFSLCSAVEPSLISSRALSHDKGDKYRTPEVTMFRPRSLMPQDLVSIVGFLTTMNTLPSPSHLGPKDPCGSQCYLPIVSWLVLFLPLFRFFSAPSSLGFAESPPATSIDIEQPRPR